MKTLATVSRCSNTSPGGVAAGLNGYPPAVQSLLGNPLEISTDRNRDIDAVLYPAHRVAGLVESLRTLDPDVTMR